MAKQLESQGITTLLPVIREIHRWSDRRKIVEVPMFRGYLFVRCCISPVFRRAILFARGVGNFVTMIGARGLLNDLHYLNPSQVPGFANSHSKVAEGFYSHRVSVRQYLGAKYAYQSLLATPHNSLTETHGVELFYTIYLQPMRAVYLD